MDLVTRTLVLTGGRTGMTVALAKRYVFVEGKIELRGSPAQVDAWTLHLGRKYKAFMEGSDALARQLEIDNGNSSLQEMLKRNSADKVPADGGQELKGAADVPPSDSSPTDEGGDAPTKHVPDGDGHADTGNGFKTAIPEAIRQAIAELDPTDDDVWTGDGLPRVDAVAAMIGKPDLSRRELNEHAPEMVRPNG